MPIFEQAGNSNLVYAAATPSAQHAVLVPANSPVRTVADLKGKRVAFGKGSSAHNVAINDRRLQRRQGDAWVVWDPYYAIAEQRYNARVIASTSDKRLASASYYMAHRDFATKYPQVPSAVPDEIGKTTRWAGEHREELAALAAEATGIDVKSWSTAFNRAEFTFGPVTAANVQQQALADSFAAPGIVPRKINVSEIVWQWDKP